ncbi:hypothetical protein GCM10010994_19170 [Chelatococcus reniformis]|uniref:Solute-binding protein family 5 domain-containing protein n=1 Tax=Chelatococcus reniformis TaxID=1494448 RepID=A0A916U5A0_9HYPH|nr:hypothetical protein GCM10010994_19170 [Chelatococcus reniformis]
MRSIAAAAALACLLPSVAGAQAEKPPQYGGTLNIGPIYLTLSPLSWDPVDWPWKFSQDTALVYEQLFVADLSKSKRNGGPYPFVADAWLPADAIRGELAESWKWTDPLRMEIKLRQGVMFPDKPGVMASRELVADDVVESFNRLNKSPKRVAAFFDYIKNVEATDKHTVVFNFNNYNSEWDYRFGWGYYSGIVPKEVFEAGAGNWRNVNGTGPFRLTDYVQGNAVTFSKNDIYWDKETIDGQAYKLPFTDKIIYRTIKDEAAYLAALRTGKLDILESVRWSAVDELKKSAPKLQWSRWLDSGGTFLAMRVDKKPFDDIRVRRALNMAVNKQEIMSAFYGGHAELFAYPQHPDYVGYFEPLDKMPESVKELFVYDPAKAKKLLAEAGYPNGFTFDVQVCSCSPNQLELLPLVAAYLEQVGVKINIKPTEVGAFISALTTKTHAPGFFLRNGHTNPTATIRKNFVTGQPYNPSVYSDPALDKKMDGVYAERDENKRQETIKELTRNALEQATYIYLPTGYGYTAWWPWVKNYGGELRAGAERAGPIHARIWIDQDMKKAMGF